jgi:hypothetical protein
VRIFRWCWILADRGAVDGFTENSSSGNFKTPVLYVALLAMYGILDADIFVDGARSHD